MLAHPQHAKRACCAITLPDADVAKCALWASSAGPSPRHSRSEALLIRLAARLDRALSRYPGKGPP